MTSGQVKELNRKERGQTLILLRKQQIPNVGKGKDGIKGATLKSVLRAIDDHGNMCWASAETLAFETCLGRRTVIRAIDELEKLGLISVERRPGAASVIRLLWDNFNATHADAAQVESISTHADAAPTHADAAHETKRNEKKRPRKRHTTKSSSTKVDESLLAWIQFWNQMKDKGIVTSGASETPSEGVKTGWKRVQASKPLQKLLSDKQAIECKIREQPFLLGSWFCLPKLFGGKNRDGEYIAAKIMAGGYASTAKPNGRTVSYTGEYDPSLPDGDL